MEWTGNSFRIRPINHMNMTALKNLSVTDPSQTGFMIMSDYLIECKSDTR